MEGFFHDKDAELHGDLCGVDKVSAKDKRVLWGVYGVDPARGDEEGLAGLDGEDRDLVVVEEVWEKDGGL